MLKTPRIGFTNCTLKLLNKGYSQSQCSFKVRNHTSVFLSSLLQREVDLNTFPLLLCSDDIACNDVLST